jgi:hypothetical protein
MELPSRQRAMVVEQAWLVIMRTWSCQFSLWLKKIPKYLTMLDASTQYSRVWDGSASQILLGWG